MSKRYPIQLNVPMCPKCAGALKKSHITHDYICRHCNAFFVIVDIGATDREVMCKEVRNNGCEGTNEGC